MCALKRDREKALNEINNAAQRDHCIEFAAVVVD